ncbi:hypothetical protein [Vibrio sp.]|uniref:hypothetical protein n=1 Tax=Vibrio sp. TaxID=678 RepID=UPI00311F10D4
MTNLIKELSPAGPLVTLLLKMKEQIDSKYSANQAYKDVYPALEELLAKGYSFESQEIQGIVSLLEKMPAWGTRREKFKKFYLKDEYGLRKLPRDPSFIPSGMWH